MNNSLVVACYVLALLAAIYLLWRFSHTRWYWHFFAVVAALIIGFMPPLISDASGLYDMVIGIAFLLLFLWGIGEFVFKAFHIHRHI